LSNTSGAPGFNAGQAFGDCPATLKAEGDVPVPWASYRAFRLPCLDPLRQTPQAATRAAREELSFFEESLIASAGLKRRAYFVDALLDARVDHIENLRLRLAVGLG
jgi:hypothetical protein